MSNVLHPGLVLIAVGFIALLMPKFLRRVVLAIGPFAGLYAALNMPIGTDISIGLFGTGYQLGYIYVDKLSYVFCMIFAMMACIGGIYSCHNSNRMEAFSSMAYAGCALGVTLAKDWLTMIFFWEALAVTSLFLIWCHHTPTSRRAGFRYLLVHMFGGNLLLGGIFLKYGTGDMLISNLAQGPHDIAFWAILIGVAVNAAIPPLNAWLVDAYPEGTITGSVFLSSFTTKVAVYCLIRIFAGADFLMGFGCFMALYGAAFAIMENDMRRLLGYHIISQVGFMVAGVGVGTAMALNGAAAHAFSHILYKSLLFMCAGAIIYATGIRKINQLSGMAKKMPFVAVCFFVAAFSISGVPFFNGFISKTITIAAASAAGYDWVYTLLELASISTFLSITLKMGYFIFLRDTDKDVQLAHKLPKNMYVAMGLGSLLCFLYGVYPDLLYRYLPFGAPGYEPYTAAHILSYIEILVVTMVPFMMFLPRMEPHTALSLDTDWFYRKPIAFIIYRLTTLFCALSGALGSAWRVLYEKFMELTTNPMDFLDAKPFRKRTHYNPENYRTSIADPMMIPLTVLVSSIAYFIATL